MWKLTFQGLWHQALQDICHSPPSALHWHHEGFAEAGKQQQQQENQQTSQQICRLTVVTISVIMGSTVSLPIMYFSSLACKENEGIRQYRANVIIEHIPCLPSVDYAEILEHGF